MCVGSVVHGDVAEQIGHGLSIVDASDGLSQNHTHIHSFDFWTLQLLHLMRYSVGHHHLEAQHNSISLVVSLLAFHQIKSLTIKILLNLDFL